MHFCDEAHIKVKAGNGGDGAIAFRREKFIPKGGPNGGNGGNGGNIIFVADENMNTLSHFLTRKHFEADEGEKGGGSDCYGRQGKDLILKVPVGTIVRYEKDGVVAIDFSCHGESYVVARGGIGGKGNANFKSSVRQAPAFAELGEPGEEKDLYLELKLIADIAIIGYPSVGKSTLISRISNARPKIADYPFTTLIPNLGVVKVDDVDFVVADIPGLIEGAHEGKGLGIQFLKHIERSKFLIHLLDLTREDLLQDYKSINHELACYSKVLAKRKQILVINKADAVSRDVVLQAQKKFAAKKPLMISAVSGKGLSELLYTMKEMVQKERRLAVKTQAKKTQATLPNVADPGADMDPRLRGKDAPIFRPHLNLPDIHAYSVQKEENQFRVSGRRLEQIAVMTDFHNTGGLQRLRDVFKKVGVQKQLIHLGAHIGDTIVIGEKRFEFVPLN